MLGRSSNRDLLESLKRGTSTLQGKVQNVKTHVQDVFSQIQVLEQMEKLILQNKKLNESDNKDIEKELAIINSIKEEFQKELMDAARSPILPSTDASGAQIHTDHGTLQVSPKTEAESINAASQKQIAMLKTSRDKLLFEIDRLSVELDSFHSSNEQLKKQMQDAQLLALYWKQHSIDSNKKVEHLKDMLDESSEACAALHLPETEILSSASKLVEKEQKSQELMTKLMESEQRNKELRESWLPVLRNLETKLMELNSTAINAFD